MIGTIFVPKWTIRYIFCSPPPLAGLTFYSLAVHGSLAIDVSCGGSHGTRLFSWVKTIEDKKNTKHSLDVLWTWQQWEKKSLEWNIIGEQARILQNSLLYV